MMETIRSAANHVVVKIIFAIIILCFMFTGVGFLGFGGGGSARDEQQYIAKVDGEGISRQEFESQVQNVTANIGQADPSLIKQLRREVLSSQIDHHLSYQFSRNLKVDISNEQVKNAIRQQTVFFENGQFNNKKYLELLSMNDYTPDSYAEVLRAALQQQQVIDALINSAFVLPVDSQLSLLQDQIRKASIAIINSSIVNMDDVNVSVEDAQKYYDEHKNEFFKKERVKFKYIANLKQDILPTITINDNEINNEYQQNAKEYAFPAKNEYSVIYVSDKEQADDIVKDLTNGGIFDDVVKIVNQSNEASPYGKNGSLGWFSDDDSLPKPFKDANLSNIGQISTPVAVDGGYLIVKLDDVQPMKMMNFSDAKATIRAKLEQQKADEIYQKHAEKLQAELAKSSETLETIAEKSGLKSVDVDWVYFNDNETIMRFTEVKDVAFSGEMLTNGKATGKISGIIPIGSNKNEGDVIIQVTDYHPEGVASFEEVKQSIHNTLYANIENERFKSTINGLLVELKQKEATKSVSFSKDYTLTRNAQDLNPQVVNMIFNLIPPEKTKDVFGVEFVGNNSAYIADLTQVITPQQEKDISAQLLPLIMNDTQYYLFNDIRAKANIEIMPNANL